MTKIKKSRITKQIRHATRQTKVINKNTLHVSFWQRKSTAKAQTKSCSVICRLTHNTLTKHYSTGIVCERKDFDPQTLTVSGQPLATLLLRDISAKAQATFADLRLTERPVSLSIIWSVANGHIHNLQIPSLLGCLNAYFEQDQDRFKVGEIQKSVLDKTKRWNTCIANYSHSLYGKSTRIDDINPADAKRFKLHIMARFDFGNNYAANVTLHFKRVLNYAVENEWIERNPFMGYRRKLEHVKGDILTENEFDLIRNFEIFAPAVDLTRIVFCFQCYTGLSYSELTKVNISDIMKDAATGAEYIKVCRGKTAKSTGAESIIPLNFEAKRIIQLFDNQSQRLQNGVLIPVLSNQKYNSYLKQLAGITNIKKRFTSHMARRTAATYYLTKGVPLESVSAMLGHANTAMTQKYYAVTRPQRVIEDFTKNGIEIYKAS